jgi:hypothetical protein
MATYGDITRSQMAFLVELVRRSRAVEHASQDSDPSRVVTQQAPQGTADGQPAEGGRAEWLLTMDDEHAKLIRAGTSWSNLPADRAFYASLVDRGYLGMLASDDISSGEVVIWPTDRAIALAKWVASSSEGTGEGSVQSAPEGDAHVEI